MTRSLATKLERLSADEMVRAMGLENAPRVARRVIAWPLRRISARLGRVLARFDDDVARIGIASAARDALRALDVSLATMGSVRPEDALLVIANHPGAYDALALFASVGRRDVRVIADERTFLRALPNVVPHLLFAADDASSRASVGRDAIAHLGRGGAVLHFAAGAIEPDPAFVARGDPLLGPWQAGTGHLVRAAARARSSVALAAVRGVHSMRAKRLAIVRWAEHRGITTLAPLVQIALRMRDVNVQLRFEDVDASELVRGQDARAITDALRARMERSLGRR